MQHLFYAGDNLDGLRLLAEQGIQVDLVYIDPPFATNNDFLIDDDRANTVSASGHPAYSDTAARQRPTSTRCDKRLRRHTRM